jgi:putative PIN family toxin of toxin-antitoxin system
MKYYAVIDTNVLVSALLKRDSVPWHVAEEALHGDIIPVLNNEILAEYEDVLNRPKFKFEKRAITVLMNELIKRGVFAEAGLIEEVIPDPKDVVFYAVLMEKRKEEEAYLITGNLKHFPTRTYIVTPKEMLDIIQESE